MNLFYVSKEFLKEIYVLFLFNLDKAYLPGTEVNHDHEGGSSRVRLFHCTLVWLTPTITPNVGNLSAQFLLVGDCACALPQFNPGNYKTVLVELARLDITAPSSGDQPLMSLKLYFICQQSTTISQLCFLRL